MGIAHYMTKPLDVAVFNKQIRALIAKQEAT
jgi:DNA-binding response OmpR family regulator